MARLHDNSCINILTVNSVMEAKRQSKWHDQRAKIRVTVKFLTFLLFGSSNVVRIEYLNIYKDVMGYLCPYLKI